MRRLIVLAAALVVIVVAEGAVRWLAGGLEPPLEWYDEPTRTKAIQMDRLSADGASVVFVGTSMMRDAADPELMLAAGLPAVSAYNAALSNTAPVIVERWLKDHVVPRLRPDLVVWGLASFQLNDAAPSNLESARTYFAAPRSQRDLGSRLEATLDDLSYLFRYQTQLRSPTSVKNAIVAVRRGEVLERPSLEDSGEITPLGRTLTRATQTMDDVDIDVQARTLEERTFADFTMGGEQIDALRAAVAWLHARDVDVVFVVMPTPPRYATLHPDGEAGERDFLAAIGTIATDLGVPVLRPDLVVKSPSQFADLLHLNQRGVEPFTAYVVESLLGLVRDGAIRDPR